ncbi:MAG: XdhC family protein [Microthrixaceae bacterium]|nr:XdhC family protein [Microthrixaceae bacterium]
MKELLDDLERWGRSETAVVLARVVDLEGSGPRTPGAAMAVSADGEVSGSVSGGCVEGAVVAEAMRIHEAGGGRLVSFGYSDDDAFAVGLTCGGTIHLYIELLDRRRGCLEVLQAALRVDEATVLATVVEAEVPALVGAKLVLVAARGGEPVQSGTLGDSDLDRVVARDALGELAAGRCGVRHYGLRGEARERAVSVFIESFAPPPRMVIFGAVDFTAALVRVAKVLGYHVTVCDAREMFATRRRFPLADEVVVDWPQRLLERIGPQLGPRDAVCVLTHDHKFDVPAVVAALGTDVGYLGAMGSRRTTEERRERLLEAGVGKADLRRLMAPIGLDIAARTPEETAISICAEIIAARTGRAPASLRDTVDAIHPRIDVEQHDKAVARR